MVKKNDNEKKLQSYTIFNTDIFDPSLISRIEELLSKRILVAEEDKHYSITVIFNVELLDKKEQMNDYYATIPKYPNEISKKYDYKEIIYIVLGYILNLCIDIFLKYFKIESSTIAGDNIGINDIIKIEIIEREPHFYEEGRSKRKIYCRIQNIMPNRGYTHHIITKLLNEKVNDFFDFCYEGLGYGYMSEVLGIEETDNINILFREFINQYKHLFTESIFSEENLLAKTFREQVFKVLAAHGEVFDQMEPNDYETKQKNIEKEVSKIKKKKVDVPLDSIAKQLGVSKDKLQDLIDKEKINNI